MYITNAGSFSGVDRYIEILTTTLAKQTEYQVICIRFIYDRRQLFVQDTLQNGCRFLSIPFPQHASSIMGQPFHTNRYFKKAYRIVTEIFPSHGECILHLHTLNLINFALEVKRHHTCRIITHVHWIPWKQWYNNNRTAFNQAYKCYYIQKDYKRMFSLVCRNHEYPAYQKVNCIVCVTACAKDFLKNVYQKEDCVHIISNGCAKIQQKNVSTDRSKGGNRLLYVGNLSESKGLQFILQALAYVQQKGYVVKLTIAGKGSKQRQKELQCIFPQLDLQFTGLLTQKELQQVYTQNDIGIIASIQEQCSYAAIEMMRAQLPIITTAVDGLDEMFQNDINSLKVNTYFSTVFGLSVDIKALAENIIRLLTHPEERYRLGQTAYQHYLGKYTQEHMLTKTMQLYKEEFLKFKCNYNET